VARGHSSSTRSARTRRSLANRSGRRSILPSHIRKRPSSPPTKCTRKPDRCRLSVLERKSFAAAPRCGHRRCNLCRSRSRKTRNWPFVRFAKERRREVCRSLWFQLRSKTFPPRSLWLPTCTRGRKLDSRRRRFGRTICRGRPVRFAALRRRP